MENNYKNLWVEKYRPSTLDSLVLEPDIRADILKYKDAQEIPHLLFHGSAGGGKTTLARIIVNEILDCQYLYINASDENGIETVRGKIKNFAEIKSLDGKLKVIVLDEIDGFSSNSGTGTSAQQALRNVMEEYSKNCRFILTGNVINKIISPIISRCIIYKIDPPVNEFMKRCAYVLKQENIKVENAGEFVNYVKGIYPDMRLAINSMQRDSMTGTLIIKTTRKTPQIVDDILSYMLKKDADPIQLRKTIIERASEFNSDYSSLLHGLFNAVYDWDMSVDKKKEYMIELSCGLYKHTLVMDKEINCYATLLKLV